MNRVTESPSSSTAVVERGRSRGTSAAVEIANHPTDATRERVDHETVTDHSARDSTPDDMSRNTPIRDNDGMSSHDRLLDSESITMHANSTNRFTGKALSINITYLKARPWYFVLTPICPSESLNQSCDLDCMELEPNGPSHIFKDDHMKFWGLNKSLETFVAPKAQKNDKEQLRELVESACLELQEEWRKVYKAEKEQSLFCTIICPPCRCAIHDALIISNNKKELWERKLEFSIRIDERLPTTCCPQADKLKRLQTLAVTLHEFDEGKLTKFHDGGQLQKVDLFYLEQRIRRLEMDRYWGA